MKEGPLDSTIDSPNSYDNIYFQNLLINTTKLTRFQSDLQLLTDPYALRMVRRLSRNQPYFFQLTVAVITYMTTAGWSGQLYYVNIWKYIEGPTCEPQQQPQTVYAAPIHTNNISSVQVAKAPANLQAAAQDQSTGNETVNVITNPNAIVTKPQDVVQQQALNNAINSAFTPVVNETTVTPLDLPAAAPVPMK